MKPRLLLSSITMLALSAGLSAQGLSGNFHMTGVQVQYFDVARNIGPSANDSTATMELNLSWPSAAGAQFQYPVKEYAAGDTVAAPVTPALLLTPEGLAAYGISLYVNLDATGTLTIPTSTYPTTTTLSCSTFAYIPTIQDAGQYEWDGNDINGGFGIVESNIFDLFSMDPSAMNHGWANVTRNWAGDVSHLQVNWIATDGQGSDSGIDANGDFNRVLGIPTLPADQGLVAYLAAYVDSTLNVGTYPTAGENFPGDAALSANWMYLFDPSGSDGTMFSGDEFLQFTGYYFTYNDLAAIATFVGTFTAYYTATGDLNTSVTAAASGTLQAFGLSAEVAAAVAATAYNQLLTYLGAGMALEDALLATMLYSIGAAEYATQGAWAFPDDSDHDFNGASGRLVFEKGNECVPDMQTRVVTAYFENLSVGIAPADGALPKAFALLGNYPNPFNPETRIAFEIEKGSDVAVNVFTILGEHVATIHRGELGAGRYDVSWQGKDGRGRQVPSGVYLYEVKSGDRALTGKMALLK